MPVASASNADPDEIVNDSFTFKRAFKDLRDGFGQRELWLSLGWQDIKQKYRRSVLGPFWITLATGVQAAAMGFLYSALFKLDVKEFLPYVTVGLIVWNLISAAITDGSEVFIANEGLIKQLPSALSVHVYRLVWRQLLLFAHNFVIYFVLLIVLGTWRQLHLSVLLAVPAMALIALNVIWASLVIGIFSTRFRDIAPIMQSLTLLLFVLTPIFWTTKSLHNQGAQMSERAKLAELNPLFHYLEIIRGPLIGEHVAAYHWYIVIVITVVGWLLALLSMKKFRSRVPYWV